MQQGEVDRVRERNHDFVINPDLVYLIVSPRSGRSMVGNFHGAQFH